MTVHEGIWKYTGVRCAGGGGRINAFGALPPYTEAPQTMVYNAILNYILMVVSLTMNPHCLDVHQEPPAMQLRSVPDLRRFVLKTCTSKVGQQLFHKDARPRLYAFIAFYICLQHLYIELSQMYFKFNRIVLNLYPVRCAHNPPPCYF